MLWRHRTTSWQWVWHGGLPAADGDQALQYSVYRVSAQSKSHGGALYLSGRSHLSWLGFSETGLLAAHDTQVRTQPARRARRDGSSLLRHAPIPLAPTGSHLGHSCKTACKHL